MLLLLIITVFLGCGYILLMFLYSCGWYLQPGFSLPKDFIPSTRISIIIPARNEALNILSCLHAILSQEYPEDLFEIILVDDFSTDETAFIAASLQHPNIKVLRLADHMREDEAIVAYKKKALATGIEHSQGELIVTTDADCTAPPGWLHHIAALYERDHPEMIVAPVDFTGDGSLVQTFQSLDFMSMQGITAAAHRLGLGNMSNGANLAFTRSAFDAIGGYQGTDHLASGDDYLLMMKIQTFYPGRIGYLKAQQAIVKTSPQPDWPGFLNQRIRWASKSGKYNDSKLTLILLLVYLFNLLFPILAVAGIFRPECWLWIAVLFLLKVAIEVIYLLPVAGFFRKRRQLVIFPFLQPLHIAYIIVAGFLGFTGQYQWKGRTVK